MATSNTESGASEDKKRVKYLTKVVKFGKESLTLYSLDGNTWSSRRQELTEIMNRHEQERLKSIQAMGEPLEGDKGDESPEDEGESKADKDAPVEDESDLELEGAADLDVLDEELEDEGDEAPPVKSKGGAGKSAPVAAKSKASPTLKAVAKPAKKGAPKPQAAKSSAKKKPTKAKK